MRKNVLWWQAILYMSTSLHTLKNYRTLLSEQEVFFLHTLLQQYYNCMKYSLDHFRRLLLQEVAGGRCISDTT
jgi:hypothetical protein